MSFGACCGSTVPEVPTYGSRDDSAPAHAQPVDVYLSARVAFMYLYVRAGADLSEVIPEPLVAHFGEQEAFLNLALWPERPLARVAAERVLAAIAEQGFYLQMPPTDGSDPLAPTTSADGR